MKKAIHFQKIHTSEGAPIVLLHGFCEHSVLWDETIETFKNSYSFITIDLPGFGVNAHLTFDSIENVAAELNQLLQKELNQRYILVGHSLGGYVAANMLIQEPQTKLGVSMVHSSFRSDTEEKKEARLKLIDFLNHQENIHFLKEFQKKLVAENLFERLQPKIWEMIHPQTNEALINTSKAMMKRPDLRKNLPHINIPIQFVIGENDSFWNIAELCDEAAMCNVSQIDILKGVHHLGMWESPEAFYEKLSDFVAFCQKIELLDVNSKTEQYPIREFVNT